MMTTAPTRTTLRLMPMSKILAVLKEGSKIISTAVKGNIIFVVYQGGKIWWRGRCHKSFCSNKFNLINSAFLAAVSFLLVSLSFPLIEGI